MRNLTLALALLVQPSAWAEPPTEAPPPAEPPPAEPLPDVAAEAIRGQCEIPLASDPGARAAGADQQYLGEFTLAADGSVTGFERRLLFANETWKTEQSEDGHSGRDCINHWDVQGTTGRPSGCRDCDLSITFQADISYDASTCPQRLVVDGNHFRASYDIKKHDDGTVEFFFSKSGKKLGQGYWRGERMSYISEHRCIWL